MTWREEAACVYQGDSDGEEEEEEEGEEEEKDEDEKEKAPAPAASASSSSYRTSCQLQVKRREEPRSSAVLIQSTFRGKGSKQVVQRRKQAVAVIQSSVRGRAGRKAAADARISFGGSGRRQQRYDQAAHPRWRPTPPLPPRATGTLLAMALVQRARPSPLHPAAEAAVTLAARRRRESPAAVGSKSPIWRMPYSRALAASGVGGGGTSGGGVPTARRGRAQQPIFTHVLPHVGAPAVYHTVGHGQRPRYSLDGGDMGGGALFSTRWVVVPHYATPPRIRVR